jgi:hypothetical protein
LVAVPIVSVVAVEMPPLLIREYTPPESFEEQLTHRGAVIQLVNETIEDYCVNGTLTSLGSVYGNNYYFNETYWIYEVSPSKFLSYIANSTIVYKLLLGCYYVETSTAMQPFANLYIEERLHIGYYTYPEP